jgi:hypothetical protein
MRTTADFFRQVRNRPKFIEALARDPVYVEHHMTAIEHAIERINELADEDVKWLAIYDRIRVLLTQESMSIKERLLALGEILRPVHAEATRRPGH